MVANRSNKTDCDNAKDWYHRNAQNIERVTGVKQPVFGTSCINENKPKKMVSKLDYNLKRFVEICSEMENTINVLARERDSPRINDEYVQFRKELSEMKRKAIVESYERNCFEWKFE